MPHILPVTPPPYAEPSPPSPLLALRKIKSALKHWLP